MDNGLEKIKNDEFETIEKDVDTFSIVKFS